MKLTVDRQQFLKAITTVDGIIPAREIRSVYSNVLVEVDRGTMSLTTTDLEMSLKTRLEVKMETKGSTTVPARKMAQIISTLDGDTLELSLDGDRILIKPLQSTTRARMELVTSPASDYPSVPLIADTHFSAFPAAVLREMIHRTQYAMAQDDSRYVFNGIFGRTSKSEMVLVATDGRRLSKIQRDLGTALPFKDGIILPAKAVKELFRLLDASEDASVAFDEKERRVHFRIGSVELIVKLIDGSFPDYEQVIPKKIDYRIRVQRSELEKAIRQAASVAIDPARQVRLQISQNSVGFQSSTPDLGKGDNQLDCDYSGPDMTIGFNSVYLLDVLKVIDAEEVSIGFTSPSAPAVVTDPSDSDFVAVVMPMKI